MHAGIGHKRDSTQLDEVANTSFDTPSKVIAGIKQQFLRRVREAQQAWQDVAANGVQVARNARLAIERRRSEIQADTAALLNHPRQDN